MSFGLNPAQYLVKDGAPRLWWGARAIYHPNANLADQRIELLHDRQQITPADGPLKEVKALLSWISRRGLGKLRKELRLNDVRGDSSCLTWITDGDFNIIGDPKGSYGYIYLAAWRNEPCLTQHEQKPPGAPSSSGGPPTAA